MTGTIRRGKIIRADLAQWDGKTATASRIDSTGGTVSGLAIGNEVDVLQVYGSGTDRTRATILAATNYINTTDATLVFAPGTWTIDDNLTIGSNFVCHIPQGCVFNISSGKTLTFLGPVIQDASDCASGAGTIVGANKDGMVFGGYYPKSSDEISAGVTPTNYSYPPLNVIRYGADSTGTSDSATAFNNASKIASYGGGGIVDIPAGTFKIASTILFYTTPNLGQVIFRGAGKVATTLNYTGSSTALGVDVADTRIYDCGIKDMTVYNSGGSGTIGLDLDSVSTSHFEHVTVKDFPVAVKLHSTVNGGATYNRFYDVTAQMPTLTASIGFQTDATQSNANHFIACRYNGPGNTLGTAWKMTDCIGNTVTDCDIDQCLIGFQLTSSGAGNCDYNIIKGNRIELCGTVYSIGTNVRFTKIFGNAYQSNTTIMSDSGTYNDIWDPPANCVEYIAGSGLTAYNTGSRSLVNKADPGGAYPFVLVDDTVSSTAGASGMNILKSASNGMYLQGYLSGALKFQVSAPGGVGFFGATAPTSRPTVSGSKGANAALTSLMTALAACGIVTDSTT